MRTVAAVGNLLDAIDDLQKLRTVADEPLEARYAPSELRRLAIVAEAEAGFGTRIDHGAHASRPTGFCVVGGASASLRRRCSRRRGR